MTELEWRGGRGWRDGYHEGQADLLTRLEGNVPADEDPLAPVSERHALRYALWCLAHNLAAAGLMQAQVWRLP